MAKAKSVSEEIDAVKARSSLKGRALEKMLIYTGSLDSRIIDIAYARNSIDLHSTESSEITAPFQAQHEKRDFYTTIYWALCYSAFDILAHVINSTYPVVKDESKVSFGAAINNYNRLKLDARGSLAALPVDLVQALEEIDGHQYFQRLKSYRHCAMHRRAVCTAEQRATFKLSAAYSTTTGAARVDMELFICDDPDDMKPKFNRKRLLLRECDSIQEKLQEDIVSILRML